MMTETSSGTVGYSNVATVIVYPILQGGTLSPSSASVNYNTGPGQLTGTVPTGGNGIYSYQWQSSPNSSTWTSISGATSQNYTPGDLTAATYYRREATSNGVSAYSNTATISVYPQLTGGSIALRLLPSTITPVPDN